jgi:DNA-binding GntR family transcriptional regulator
MSIATADAANRLIVVLEARLPGQPVGTLGELADQYGLSDDAMVGVLADLVDLGYLRRVPGVGLFVAGPRALRLRRAVP